MSRRCGCSPGDTGAVRFRLEAGGLTDVGRRRQNNEDCFAIVPLGEPATAPSPQAAVAGPLAVLGVLLVVADGLGGARAGEVASRLAVAAVVAELRANAAASVDMAETLFGGVAAAHAAVSRAAEGSPEWRGMGCTLSVLWVRPGRAALAHVGDSRIYRWHAGRLDQLTRDQTVVQGLAVPGGSVAGPDVPPRLRGVLEQAIGGDGDIPQPQVDEFAVGPGDRFLLCTDGCHDRLGTADFAARLGATPFAPVACARGLVGEACRRGGHDNITVIVAGCAAPVPHWLGFARRWLGRS